jgi:hypothetical protein
MFGLFQRRKKAQEDPGVATAEQFVVPVNLDAAHTFAAPGASKYSSPQSYGANPYAPKLGTELPTVKHQDAILNHFFSPPPDVNPQAYYEDRNLMKLRIGRGEELFQTRDWQAQTERQVDAVQPWDHTPVSTRPTSTQSPSDYRFIRPFDQRWEKNGNGNSFSAAQLGMAYPLGGMEVPRNFRNTLRLQPAGRDTENVDLSGTTTATVTPAVYVSPQSAPRKWGL